MSGPASHRDYVSDDGTTYRVLVPDWQAGITGDAAATATVGMPKGYQRRHRMLQDPATGHEYRITVGSIASAAWTAGFGAAVAGAPQPPGHTGLVLVYGGRIGERDLIRG